MQRKLSRLAHGTHKQANASHTEKHPVGTGEHHSGQFVFACKDFGIVERTGISQNQTNAQDEAEVTHTVDQEGLHVGKHRRGTLEPKTNQQVRHQTHRFPAKEQLEHVVAHDQHEHGEGEQRNVRKETVVAFVFMHVTDGVNVHHQRHECDHTHHHGGQTIDQKTNFHFHATDHHPFV